MTLREQFEKEYHKQPVEPYPESEDSEQWLKIVAWEEKYLTWLKNKLLQSIDWK